MMALGKSLLKLLLPVVGITCVSASATAGDATAHTAAMAQAADQVAGMSDFANGVGAPLLDKGPHPTRSGQFRIPRTAVPRCPYDPDATYNDGSCPYADANGLGVNLPDNWRCDDPRRQPPEMNSLNARLSPPAVVQLTNGVDYHGDVLSLVCNWNHFKANPILPPDYSAPGTVDIITAWAEKIPADIEALGGHFQCDVDGWQKYYGRIANELHFVQDMQSEHHALGNVVCSDADIVPLATYRHFSFREHKMCAAFVTGTINSAKTTQTPCDGAVVAQDVGLTALSGPILGAVLLCARGVSLSCMGIERTLRHHCKLPDVTKSLQCSGRPDDHSVNPSYCEGEILPGGSPGFGLGQDFLTPATGASVDVLQKAAARWALVCKEPDDPCDPKQCDTWCKRSRALSLGLPGTGTSGFCTNLGVSPPDCGLHDCLCADADSCGETGALCCIQGPACKNAGDECGPRTGRCVAKGAETCHQIALMPQSSTIGVNGTVQISVLVDGGAPASGYSFKWFGTRTAGTVSEAAGGRTLAATDCSSQSQVIYTQAGDASAAPDTVIVEVFDSPDCNTATGTSLGQAMATVTTIGGCIDKVGINNASAAIPNHPDGICDTYGSFTLTVAAGGASATNVTLFRTDATGLNLRATATYFTSGVWSTDTGAQNVAGNYVAHLFLATTSNPGPNDFLALTSPVSVTLAAGDNKIYFFADGDDKNGGSYGFGLNVWLDGADATSPGLSAFTAVPGGSVMADGTTGCSPAYDGTCAASAETLTTTGSPSVTLSAFTVTAVGGATAPPDAGAP